MAVLLTQRKMIVSLSWLPSPRFNLFALLLFASSTLGNLVYGNNNYSPVISNNKSSAIFKRADIAPDEWSRMKSAGHAARCDMESSTVRRLQAAVQDPAFLSYEGWITEDIQPMWQDEVGDLIHALGITHNGWDSTIASRRDATLDLNWAVAQGYTWGGEVVNGARVIQPSQGVFQNAIFLSHGLIIAENNLSPKSVLKRRLGNSQPYTNNWRWSRVVYWSDAAYLQYMLAGGHPSTIRMVARIVQNEASIKAVIQALRDTARKENCAMPTIPDFRNKRVYRVESRDDINEFNALLGTPHGRGVANLLLTHRAVLGVKRVTRIHVWTKEQGGIPVRNGYADFENIGGDYINLLFEIAPYRRER